MSTPHKSHKLTRVYTLGGFFVYAVYAFVPLGFAGLLITMLDNSGVSVSLMAFAAAAIYLAWIGINFVQWRRFGKRFAELQEFATANGLGFDATSDRDLAAMFSKASVLHLSGAREPKIYHFLRGQDWVYADLAYKVYRQLRQGEFHSETVYYGVMSVELPRELPNMFFDSKHARGRQFRFHFDKSQRRRLEGDFNEYFTTYFPNTYSIDGLSIITPDVMLALKAASEYDIELVGNRVYLYGPLFDPKVQLPDMSAKIQAIRSQLLDNINTYRDERLPYEIGRQHVALEGASLRRSKFWKRATLALVIMYLILRFGAEVFG